MKWSVLFGNESVPSKYFTWFRSTFFFCIFLQLVVFYTKGYPENIIHAQQFLIRYEWLKWLPVLATEELQLLLAVGMLASIVAALGYFFRYSSIIVFLIFTYFWTLDKAMYNNHYYLFSLVLFLFVLISFTGYNRKINKIASWYVRLFQFMLLVVFFYGGVAKTSADWLIRAEPIKSIVFTSEPFSNYAGDHMHLIALIFAWAGMLFDYVIIFLLIWGKRFFWWVTLYIGFNLLNLVFFNFSAGLDIGIFPLFLLCCLLLFIPHKQEQKLQLTQTPSITVRSIVMLFFAIQIVLPIRGYLIQQEQPIDWTMDGQRFSWHMKSHYKVGFPVFKIQDKSNGKLYKVEPLGYINMSQYILLKDNPGDVIPLAKQMKEFFKTSRNMDIGFFSTAFVEYNGRPAQLYYDSTIDLSMLDGQYNYEWIRPLKK